MKNFHEYLKLKNVSLKEIEDRFGKKLTYASKGRYGIYHILKSLNIKGSVMMPVFACDSIKYAIEKAGCLCKYYDISLEDLNGDISSIKKMYDKKVSCIIVPSLFGNPANIMEVEKFCRDKNIFMIDDAAQALGAQVDSKYIGSFGDAGLFSFSAGKPTYGHMGCYFWTSKYYKINRTHHPLFHKLVYNNFFYNRYGDYNSRRLYRINLFRYLEIFLYKILRIEDDEICKFEEETLLNVAYDNIFTELKYRVDSINKFDMLLRKTDIKLIKGVRGKSNNNKLVLLCKSIEQADLLSNKLKINDIYSGRSYKLLDNSINYPIANSIVRKVIEIPIEDDKEKMKRVFKTVLNYVKTNGGAINEQ